MTRGQLNLPQGSRNCCCFLHSSWRKRKLFSLFMCSLRHKTGAISSRQPREEAPGQCSCLSVCLSVCVSVGHTPMLLSLSVHLKTRAQISPKGRRGKIWNGRRRRRRQFYGYEWAWHCFVSFSRKKRKFVEFLFFSQDLTEDICSRILTVCRYTTNRKLFSLKFRQVDIWLKKMS